MWDGEVDARNRRRPESAGWCVHVRQTEERGVAAVYAGRKQGVNKNISRCYGDGNTQAEYWCELIVCLMTHQVLSR